MQPIIAREGLEQDSKFFIAVSIAEPTSISWGLAFDDAAQVAFEITAASTASCRQTHESLGRGLGSNNKNFDAYEVEGESLPRRARPL
jgi:hypothetical protein